MNDEIVPLELSDDEFAALSESDIAAMFDEPASEDAGSDDSTPAEEVPVEEENEEEAEEEEAASEESQEEEEESSLDTEDEEADDELNAEDEGKEIKDEDPDKESGSESEVEIDTAEDFRKEITASFRANGKDMQVESVEDIRKLMQMGANYNKKMAAIKPNLKFIKMLENNDLLNEESISYLIDLQKKDPTAITKLLKDSGTNPLELDLEKEHGYETKDTYTVSDNEVNLDGILDEIRDTDSFEQTIDIVSNKWDAKSKQILVNNPEVIQVINDHVATGIYDKITQVMNRERVLGNLDGMSDIDAYKYVGDAIHQAGGFDDAGSMEHNPSEDKPTKTVDPAVKKRKKAASSTKPTVTKKKKKASDYDILAMSDDDFEKHGAEGLF